MRKKVERKSQISKKLKQIFLLQKQLKKMVKKRRKLQRRQALMQEERSRSVTF